MSRAACAGCRREIDAAARLCPYCGADPHSGQKPVDTQAILQEVFQPRRVSAAEGVLEYARQRQGVVIAIAILVGLLLLAGVHQFIVRRNANAVSDASAVPLTEVTDLSNQPEETKQLSMPELQFQYDGHPQTMSTFVVEPGAVAPPPDVTAASTARPGPQPSQPPPPPQPPTSTQ